MTVPVAGLPMYDWPEVRDSTDRLWAALRDAFRARGIAAPEHLDRARGARALWTDPSLVLAQACGLPLVRELRGRVTVVGAPDYGVPGCAPGWYRSAIVVRSGDPRETLREFAGCPVAINGGDSQSGYAALIHHAAPLAVNGRFFGAVRTTGAHEASAAAVVAGEADLAAIDYVSWRFVRRFRHAVALRVLMLTDPTPALPFIAASGTPAGPHRQAVAAALDDLDPEDAGALGLGGFAALDAEAYDCIAARASQAEARLRL